MAFVPALIPLGVSLARISRNVNDDGNSSMKEHKDRGRAIIDKIKKGGAQAPITEWSEAKLEKAIRRNSMFRDHADELRMARVSGLLAKMKDTEKETKPEEAARAIVGPPPVPDVVDGDKADDKADEIVPDIDCEADLLLLAADEKAKNEPNRARDAALELLADNSFDAILITDTKGVIAYSNNAFTKLTGYDQADVIGRSPKLLQGPGTDRKVLDRLKESMHKGNGDYEGSAINYRKDGTPFIMHWRVVPVKVDNEIQAWVAIQREGSQIPDTDLSAVSAAAPRYNLDINSK